MISQPNVMEATAGSALCLHYRAPRLRRASSRGFGGTTRLCSMKALLLLTAEIIVPLCLVGCLHTDRPRPARQYHHYTVLVSGSAGVSFTGTVKADGVEQAVSGTAPAKLSFDNSQRLDCSFQQGAELGSLQFGVQDDELWRDLGTVSTTGPRGHCHFTVRNGELKSKP
jgi:hypothetical protein